MKKKSTEIKKYDEKLEKLASEIDLAHSTLKSICCSIRDSIPTAKELDHIARYNESLLKDFYDLLRKAEAEGYKNKEYTHLLDVYRVTVEKDLVKVRELEGKLYLTSEEPVRRYPKEKYPEDEVYITSRDNQLTYNPHKD